MSNKPHRLCSPKKDYMRLFLNYCKRYNLYFGVTKEQEIAYVTVWDGPDFLAPASSYLEFGSAQAYTWLINLPIRKK